MLEAKDKLVSFKLPEAEKAEYSRFIENLRYRESITESNFGAGKIEGEKNKATEIAKKMKSMGLSKDVIHKATGISTGEIEKI